MSVKLVRDALIKLNSIQRLFESKLYFQLEAELRSLKGRVEVLENLGSELSDIESEIQPNEPSQELVGFQTLKIIKNICEKELNDFERTR